MSYLDLACNTNLPHVEELAAALSESDDVNLDCATFTTRIPGNEQA
jgi:hypothetical protein